MPFACVIFLSFPAGGGCLLFVCCVFSLCVVCVYYARSKNEMASPHPGEHPQAMCCAMNENRNPQQLSSWCCANDEVKKSSKRSVKRKKKLEIYFCFLLLLLRLWTTGLCGSLLSHSLSLCDPSKTAIVSPAYDAKRMVWRQPLFLCFEYVRFVRC